MHASQQLFKCSFCRKNFLDNGSLTRHVNVCEKLSHTTEDVSEHPSTYVKPLKCALCSKTLKNKRTLANHMFTHKEQRVHKCSVCCRTFKQGRHVSHHIKTVHAKMKTFRCQICNNLYQWDDHRTLMHIQTHTKEFHGKASHLSWCRYT